jgi:hypothetical protein
VIEALIAEAGEPSVKNEKIQRGHEVISGYIWFVADEFGARHNRGLRIRQQGDGWHIHAWGPGMGLDLQRHVGGTTPFPEPPDQFIRLAALAVGIIP